MLWLSSDFVEGLGGFGAWLDLSLLKAILPVSDGNGISLVLRSEVDELCSDASICGCTCMRAKLYHAPITGPKPVRARRGADVIVNLLRQVNVTDDPVSIVLKFTEKYSLHH